MADLLTQALSDLLDDLQRVSETSGKVADLDRVLVTRARLATAQAPEEPDGLFVRVPIDPALFEEFCDVLGLCEERYADAFGTAYCGYWALGVGWAKGRGWLVWEEEHEWEEPEEESDAAAIFCQSELHQTRREFADDCMADFASDHGITLDEYKDAHGDVGQDDLWFVDAMQSHGFTPGELDGPAHLLAIRAWEAGDGLPDGYYRLDRAAALRAIAHGAKRYGLEAAFEADADQLDAMIQLALLGEVRYG